MFQVDVEATSANLSVGFDVLGLSLKLYNTFKFQYSNEFEFVGFPKEYSSKETNLVYQTYEYVFKKYNEKLKPIRIEFSGNIPVSRGLGSSSSLIVAGIYAAKAALNHKLTDEEVFDIAVEIEGHPDNVAPAIYGGLIAAYEKNGIYHPIKYEVSDKFKFILIVPPFELSTHEARKVLPKMLSYKDIIHNTSRIVNIPLAFKNGDIKLLKDLFSDKLHEPYRSPLIKGYDYVKEITEKDENSCCAISGSGSTMLVVSTSLDIVEKLKKLNYEILILEKGDGVKVNGEL